MLLQAKKDLDWWQPLSSVQSLSPVWLFVTPWTAAHQASLSFTNSWCLLKVMSSSQWCHQPSHPLASSSTPAFNLSQETGKVVLYSYLFKNVLQFVVIQTVKDFDIVNETK